ncbi:MAG: carboxypeptidase-like regulatory domain-containing protein, partial [Chitinophagaceae bacterium]|nr:carboxypeptidase-like regulatory domain-containing protein [Chitinophagaceae bacterium]
MFNGFLMKAQTPSIILKGRVIDFVTTEPISFATVFFEGTSIGQKADIDGNFNMALSKFPKDTLTIS